MKSGGEKVYTYDGKSNYTIAKLKELAPDVVVTSHRDPPVGTLQNLFDPKLPDLKRVGIVIFETAIQPTRGGLASEDRIFLSEQGKQLLTEGLLSVWEQSFPILSPETDFVTTSKIKKAKSFSQYGVAQEDYVKSKRSALEPDDIFFLEKGRKTAIATTLNPRGMRDLSFVLVPATELMAGPKWSEQNKHYLNDVTKELKLDAVIIVMSELNWTSSHIDKHSGEAIPEAINVKITSSTLLPLSLYHQRLESIGSKELPGVTLCYRSYEAKTSLPVKISVEAEDQNFDTIENELLSPMLKTYKDLSQMTIMKISEDLKKTY